MKTGDWDYTTLREEEFQQKVNYIAPDTPTAPNEPNRAEASLPRNLVLKPSLNTAFGVWSTDRIPKGTRFGPFVGQIYTKDSVPPDTDRKYFWRVYGKDNELFYYIDGFDVQKANWMRYVNPAYSSESQNLIACQYEMNIYFYTVKEIDANQELLVWYCREFAERLNHPVTGEQMLQKILGVYCYTNDPCSKKPGKYDPSQSEAYKALQEEGYDDHIQHVSQPTRQGVFSPQKARQNRPAPFRPKSPGINIVDGDGETIHQSNSFKRIMYSVLGQTDY